MGTFYHSHLVQHTRSKLGTLFRLKTTTSHLEHRLLILHIIFYHKEKTSGL